MTRNILLLLGLLFTTQALAWKYDISLGYGGSKEIGYDYYQHGFMLDAQMFPFKKLDKTLIVGLGLSLANWHANTGHNKNMSSTALLAVARGYFAPPENLKIRPYLTGSIGPTYLFQRKFGEREHGSNFAFQISLGLGSEFKIQSHEIDFNLKLIHYCNAGISRPNQSINILYVFSIGYLFG